MKKLAHLLAILTVAALPLSAFAQGKKPGAPPAPSGPQPKWEPGPKKISLGHQLTLDLPAGNVYLNASDAKKLLAKSGNFMSDDFIGMVIPDDPTGKSEWWVSISYSDEGFIKDDEKIDADDLLKNIREGNEEGNKERVEKGFPALHVDSWSEPPHYDKGLHHLVWALEAHSDRGKSVNFNTRVLGRKGVVSINLITDPESLAKDKPAVEKLLLATTFDSGARYADFDSKTDKVATYGLIGLIAGGAGIAALKIAKVGIFGKFLLPLFAKFFKLIAIALIAIGAFVKKIFTGGKPASQTTPGIVDQGGNPPGGPSSSAAAPKDPHNDGSGGSSA